HVPTNYEVRVSSSVSRYRYPHSVPRVLHDNGVDLQHFTYVHGNLLRNVLTLNYAFDLDYGREQSPVITGTITLKLLGIKLLEMRIMSRKESPVQEVVSFGNVHVMAVTIPEMHNRTLIMIGLYGHRTGLYSRQ
ncbi:unnamed protein product, partial [Medioppia subpectinata]